jgi:hypothetical protein
MSNVQIHHEVMLGHPGQWRLCFQWVRYRYEDGSPSQDGYRFIWRRPDDSLQPARGQARIPSAAELLELLSLASRAGWFVTAEGAAAVPVASPAPAAPAIS